MAAIRQALLADADFVATFPGGVSDEAREDVAFPHLTFDNVEAAPDDTDGIDGAVVQIGLEVHVRRGRKKGGRVAALKLCAIVRAVLHRREAALTVDGLTAWRMEVQTVMAERKADGQTYRGVVALQAWLHA